MAAPDYAFLRRPVWLVGAVLALAAAALFVRLGMWQLSRHDERRDFNAAVAAVADLPSATLAELGAGAPEYRPVTVSGTYVPGTTVLLQNRSYRGSSGVHVITALQPAAGPVVAVDRGWVPLAVYEDPERIPPAATGAVTVTGRVREGRDGAAVSTADRGLPARLNRVDLGRLAELWRLDVAPRYVELTSQQPALGPEAALPADPPELGLGPHLPYAMQWFAFALIAVAGFGVLAHRTARRPAPTERPPDVARPKGLG